MKSIRFFSAIVLVLVIFIANQSFAQKVGIAADKQKQENLEKNKKRQAELKKKYNSLTPEQAAIAREKANEYKKSGGKRTEPAAVPAGEINKTSGVTVTSKTTVQQKQGTVKKKVNGSKPVWMDSKGKPQPAKPAVKPGTPEKAKPATSGIKTGDKK